MKKCLAALFAVVAVSSSVHAAQYSAVVLPKLPSTSFYFGTGIFGSQKVGTYYGQPSGENTIPRAVLWDASNSITSLHPSGYYASTANEVWNGVQVGSAQSTSDVSSTHAVLWQGTAASMTDIHPDGYARSNAISIHGSSVVGYAYAASDPHAGLWSIETSSFVDLNPSNVRGSLAMGVYGNIQVGQTTAERAAMWRGSAESFQSLHPTSGFWTSLAVDVYDKQIVGEGRLMMNNQTHALLWDADTLSYIDLNPSGITLSHAFGVGYGVQVGMAGSHAAAWFGSAGSYVDLHAFLPFEATISRALDVNADGSIIGYATLANGDNVPVLWTFIPEPGMLLGLPVCLLTLLRTRK